MAYFPMYVDLEKQQCLVAGGGRVALRKVRTMLEFGAYVNVVSPVILPEIEALDRVRTVQRTFQEEDLQDAALVIAATDDPKENHRIAEICRTRHIPVNAVDQVQDCTFIFPSIVREGDLIAAFSSGGKSPLMTQMLKEKEGQILTPRMGQINDLLGNCRERVKASFTSEQERKKVYRAILDRCLERPDDMPLPGEEEISEILQKIQ